MRTGPCPSRFTAHVSLLTFHCSRFTSPFAPRGGESCSPARYGRDEAGFVTGDYESRKQWVSCGARREEDLVGRAAGDSSCSPPVTGYNRSVTQRSHFVARPGSLADTNPALRDPAERQRL